jgi:hypothetical protein
MFETRAWYLYLSWSPWRKHLYSNPTEEEDAAFAKDRPREAEILQRKEDTRRASREGG